MNKLEKESLSEMAFNSIKEYIIESGLQYGDKMPSEKHFIESLGVSRSTIREAFKMLKSLGFINIQNGKGSYVENPNGNIENKPIINLMQNENLIEEAMQVRMALETYAIRVATLNCSDSDLQELELIQSNFADALKKNHVDLLAESDISFHKKIIAMARNSLLEHMYSEITAPLENFFSNIFKIEGIPLISSKWHNELVLLMKKRNAKKASEVMYEHIESSLENMKKIEHFVHELKPS